jgi:hypothetical protein
MNTQLLRLLDHLSVKLDPWRQAEIEQLHRQALRWEPVRRLPLTFSYPIPPDAPFQPFPHSKTFEDPQKMLYNELVNGFDASIACRDRLDDDQPLAIRANFGTVLVASMLGGRMEQVGENPPWCRPFETIDEFREATELDPLDFSRGWCPRVNERYQFYRQTLDGYPELARLVHLALPDLQGPLDTAELLRGCQLYVDMCVEPEFVARALKKIAQAQVGFASHLLPLLGNGDEPFSHQHAQLICGQILMRDDSAILISPDMYRQHVAGHDAMVLHELGGGGLHACGKAEHVIEEFFALPSIRCLDLGQPELNNIDGIYAKARRRRIAMVRGSVRRDELITGRVMERFPTGVSLFHNAESLDDAQAIWAAYRDATE